MIKQQAFVIEGRLDGMNTVIHENRRHRMAGAREKKAQQYICADAIRACGVQPVKSAGSNPMLAEIRTISRLGRSSSLTRCRRPEF